jgi:hypothetical protein
MNPLSTRKHYQMLLTGYKFQTFSFVLCHGTGIDWYTQSSTTPIEKTVDRDVCSLLQALHWFD